MLKKIIGLVLAVSVILASVNVEVKANSDSHTYGSYTCNGSCWISIHSAGASTTAVPKTNAYVSGTYDYVTNPGSPNPHHECLPNSHGDWDGYAHISFSISNSSQSFRIDASHSIPESGCSVSTYEVY